MSVDKYRMKDKRTKKFAEKRIKSKTTGNSLHIKKQEETVLDKRKRLIAEYKNK